MLSLYLPGETPICGIYGRFLPNGSVIWFIVCIWAGYFFIWYLFWSSTTVFPVKIRVYFRIIYFKLISVDNYIQVKTSKDAYFQLICYAGLTWYIPAHVLGFFGIYLDRNFYLSWFLVNVLDPELSPSACLPWQYPPLSRVILFTWFSTSIRRSDCRSNMASCISRASEHVLSAWIIMSKWISGESITCAFSSFLFA